MYTRKMDYAICPAKELHVDDKSDQKTRFLAIPQIGSWRFRVFLETHYARFLNV